MTTLPKVCYEFHVIPIKISAGFLLLDIDKMILKLIYKCKRPRVVIATLKKEQTWKACHLNVKTAL